MNGLICAMGLFAVSCTRPAAPPIDQKLPDTPVVSTPPVFAKQQNEVAITDSMIGMDPTMVLGSLVNTATGQMHSLDNYLAPGAKPTVTLDGEVVFRHLIENSLAANASYLDFVSAALSDSVRAEVSVVKAVKANMKNDDLDRTRLTAELRKVAADKRNDLGVVIGYIDFVLSATYFKHREGDGNVSGYGAQIGGKWFSKDEKTDVRHRVIAVWAPLPFVIEELGKSKNVEVDLPEAATRALKAGELTAMRKLPELRLGAYLDKVK